MPSLAYMLRVDPSTLETRVCTSTRLPHTLHLTRDPEYPLSRSLLAHWMPHPTQGVCRWTRISRSTRQPQPDRLHSYASLGIVDRRGSLLPVRAAWLMPRRGRLQALRVAIHGLW